MDACILSILGLAVSISTISDSLVKLVNIVKFSYCVAWDLTELSKCLKQSIWSKRSQAVIQEFSLKTNGSYFNLHKDVQISPLKLPCNS